MTSDSSRPTTPTIIRIQPTVSMSTTSLVPVTANARIAPAAMISRLIGMPIQARRSREPSGLTLATCVEQEAPRHVARARILLQGFERESVARQRRDDPAQPPEPLGEIVVRPALEVIDAERDRMVVEHEQ